MRLRYLFVTAALVTGSAVPVAAPTATASVTVPGAAVPVSRMLQPTDVGPGYRVSDEEVMGDWNFRYAVSGCPAARWSRVDPIASRGRTLSRAEPSQEYVIQEVRRFASTDQARKVVRDISGNVHACRDFRVVSRGTGEVVGTMRMRIAASGFAGDHSIIVREVFTPAGTAEVSATLRVFVRAGALLAEVRPSTIDLNQVVALGVRAGVRLDSAPGTST
jgi:hypothetical protein